MKKFSLIVPLYNTEKYIDICIKSVINQDYKNWELIIINDGSTDNSRDIVLNYVKKDDRVKLFDQDNSGVSVARNKGIKLAKGDYIIFLDSDDWLEPNLLSTVLKYNIDFIIFGFKKCYINKVECVIDQDLIINDREKTIKSIYLNNKIQGYLCTKVFKNNIIKNNNIMFKEDIHVCEDLLFIDEYIKYSSSFKYINIPLYNYRMRKSSATFSMFKKKDNSSLDAYMTLIKSNENLNIKQFLKYMFLISYYKNKKNASNNQKKYAKTLLKEEKNIISCFNKKQKLKYYIVKYCPVLYKILNYLKNKKLNLFE